MALSVAIQKKLGNFHLNVEFETDNEKLALLGASGCGKSMTLKCIAGIEKPDKGRIVLDGRVLFDSEQKINLPPQKRKVGYLFQNYALFPNMTVEQNIAEGIPKKNKAQKKQIIAEKIHAFYLEGLEKKYPSQLSGGQQQRVALARILVSGPELLMLDEPFSALDSYLKWQLEQELQDVLRLFDGNTLFVSHNKEEVHRLCEKVCVIDSGTSQPIITVKELFENPKTLAAALLSDCNNYTKIEPGSHGYIRAVDWGISIKCDRSVGENIHYIAIRPEHLEITDEKDRDGIACTVARVSEETDFMVLTLIPDGAKQRAKLKMKTTKACRLKECEKIFVSIKEEKLLFLE